MDVDMRDNAMSVLKKALKEAEEARKNKLIELRAMEQQKRKVSDEYVNSAKCVSSISEAIRKIKKPLTKRQKHSGITPR